MLWFLSYSFLQGINPQLFFIPPSLGFPPSYFEGPSPTDLRGDPYAETHTRKAIRGDPHAEAHTLRPIRGVPCLVTENLNFVI